MLIFINKVLKTYFPTKNKDLLYQTNVQAFLKKIQSNYKKIEIMKLFYIHLINKTKRSFLIVVIIRNIFVLQQHSVLLEQLKAEIL